MNILRSIWLLIWGLIPLLTLGNNREIVHLPTEDLVREVSANKVGGYNFAHKFKTNISPNNSGEITFVENATIWTVDVKSDDAYSLSLLIKTSMQEGDLIFIKDINNQILAKYSSSDVYCGEIQTTVFPCDQIVLEYITYENLPEISITEVNHGLENIFRASTVNWNISSQDYCNEHITCLDESEYKITERSVVLLMIDGTYLMSGVLINNALNDGTPYLLTAAHGFTANDFETAKFQAQRTVFYFDYQVWGCQKEIIPSYDKIIVGADLLAFDKGLDMALLRLSSNPPPDFRPYYAGWNLTTHPSNATYCIQHPLGDPKNMSKSSIILQKVDINQISGFQENNFTRNNHWQVKYWQVGSTNVGSSGSPLFDNTDHILGCLTGGGSACNRKAPDYFYRLDNVWKYYLVDSTKQLKCWLDPNDTGLNILDGHDPYEDMGIHRVSYVDKNSVLVNSTITGRHGYATGQNSINVADYAQEFTLDEPAYLHGVYFSTIKGNDNSGVVMCVVENLGESPLASIPLSFKTEAYDINTHNFSITSKRKLADVESYVRFPETVEVPQHFYITYSVPYSFPVDTFAIYTTQTTDNHAYMYYNSEWVEFPESPFGISISLSLDVVVGNKSWLYPETMLVDTPIEHTYSESVFKLYPNPAHDFLYVEVETPTLIKIYSLDGKLLRNEKVEENAEIDIADLTPGIYIISSVSSNRPITQKLIKE